MQNLNRRYGGIKYPISIKDWFVKLPSEELLKKHKEEITSDEPNMGESLEVIGIDWHQTLMNIAYNWWQEQKNPNVVEYQDMIGYVSTEYGFIVSGLILAGKYNQQVGNGGHIQYYDNAYADGTGGCMSEKDFDHPLHRILIDWMEELEPKIKTFLEERPNYQEAFKEVLDIMKKFLELPIDDEKMIEDVEYDDEGNEEEVEYENQDYGRMDYKASEVLDERYYKVNSRFMEICSYVADNIIEYGKLGQEEQQCSVIKK